MESPLNQPDIIRQLRKQINALEGWSRPQEGVQATTGLNSIERAFSDHTIPTGAVHEFISQDRADGAATNGFLAGLISSMTRAKGSCLWVSTRRRIFPPALKAFGLSPEQVIFVDARRDKDALWTIEEGLKCASLAAVVGELRTLDFTASRRLQLAVEQSRVTGFIHRFEARAEATLACVSRWKISSLASEQRAELPGVGFPRWQVQLTKVRNGRPGAWEVEWTPAGFREVPVLTAAHTPSFIRKTG